MARERLLGKERAQKAEQAIFALQKACSPETCYPGEKEGWTVDNPFWAHCGGVAEVMRRLVGGDLLVGRVKLPNGESYRHVWNLLPGDIEKDFTADQFPEGMEVRYCKQKRKKGITDPATLKRAKLLWERANEVLGWNLVWDRDLK